MTVRGAIRRTVESMLAQGGFGLTRLEHQPPDEDFLRFYRRCKPFTMTSENRMFGLHVAMRHIAAAGIEGDVVECGVWRGGSAMLAAFNLLTDPKPRDLYLFDTFTGMSAPTDKDRRTASGVKAETDWRRTQTSDHNELCYAPLDEVRANLASTGLPIERQHFVAGKVEDTLPAAAPERVALLRLDTDWYESTRHELVHLYPRLVSGGVLIIDDYGHWAGAREAVDEYLAEHDPNLLLVPLDYTGRMALKP